MYLFVDDTPESVKAREDAKWHRSYTLGHGDWFVPHEMRRHYGKELLDQVNQQYGTTTNKFATGGIVRKPTVGRIVHYYNEGNPNPMAAIVTYVFKYHADGMCALRIFGPEDPTHRRVPFSETPKPGHWSWPPR